MKIANDVIIIVLSALLTLTAVKNCENLQQHQFEKKTVESGDSDET